MDIIAEITEDFKPLQFCKGFYSTQNVLSGVITLPKKITVSANHRRNHRQRVAGNRCTFTKPRCVRGAIPLSEFGGMRAEQ